MDLPWFSYAQGKKMVLCILCSKTSAHIQWEEALEKCDLFGPNRKKYIEYSADCVTGALSQPRLPENNPAAGGKKGKINHSELNCLIAKMKQDLINARDILPLEAHKEKVSYKPFILSPLPFRGLFIFFCSVMAGSQKMWKGKG